MKKKIIFVTKALWIGGIETALVNLLNQFDYNKYDVTLLVLHAELDMVEQINSKCRLLVMDREKTITFKNAYKYCKLYHLTEKTEHPSKLHQAMMWTIPAIKWIENRLYIQYVREQMCAEYFDTAIIYSDVVGEIVLRAIKADKYLMFYHHGAMRHVYHDKIAYKKCDKIIAVSQNQAEKLKKFEPRYAAKIITIHNLTDVEGIREKSKMSCEHIFDKTKFNIVSVGRVSYEKGMDLAVHACAKLVADGFDNIQWWIVGDGPAMPDIKDMVTELHMEKYVQLVGMKSNPYPYIRQADLYVQPSRVESFGLTIIEALILGRPVISTSTDGAIETLGKGKKGILCDVSKEKLAVNCELLVSNKELCTNLSNNTEVKTYKDENKRQIMELDMLLRGEI